MGKICSAILYLCSSYVFAYSMLTMDVYHNWALVAVGVVSMLFSLTLNEIALEENI